MNFKINADDFGLTQGITDTIIECFDEGVLNSVSILPNGHAFEYAMEQLKKRGLSLNIHLNLVEGKPILERNKVDLLINKEGYFFHSFLLLFIKYYFGSKATKEILKSQIKNELEAQLVKVLQQVGNTKGIGVDSHQYFHMIPFIFDIVIDLLKKYHLEWVRLPRESFVLSFNSPKLIKSYLSNNVVKQIVLNFFSWYLKRHLHKLNVKHNDYYIGVLFTGNMSLYYIEASLKKLPKDASVEILFHPGAALEHEYSIIAKNYRFARFYYSKSRSSESAVLKSRDLKNLIKNYQE